MPIHERDLEAEHVAAHGAVMEAARAASVGADNAADSGRTFSRIRAEKLTRASRSSLKVFENHAGSAARATGFHLYLAKALERNHPTAMRYAGAGKSRPGARNGQGHVLPGAGFDDFAKFFNIRRKEYAFRRATITGGIFQVRVNRYGWCIHTFKISLADLKMPVSMRAFAAAT
jgi:hypothetical protein